MDVQLKPKICVDCVTSMSDTPLHITVVGLQPFQLVSLHSSTALSNKKFECIAQYVADKQGCIDLKHDPSLGGSFTGIEPMGLFWAMEPSATNKYKHAKFMISDVSTPLVISITLYNYPFISLLEMNNLRKNKTLGELEIFKIELNRLLLAPGTERTVLTNEVHGFQGTLFIPPGTGLFPGVITLFGNYPGTVEFTAALLASHGFASLAIEYIDKDGVLSPHVKMGNGMWNLEYFERGVKFLSNHPRVNAGVGLGLVSTSLSTPIALALCDVVKNIKCVVWIHGFVSSVLMKIVHKEKRYDTVSYFVHSSYETTAAKATRYSYKHCNTIHSHALKNIIEFYKHPNIAFLFIAGLSDENVPAEYELNLAEYALKLVKHPNYQIIRYPGAGHLIELPYGIHHEITPLLIKTKLLYMKWGGSKVSHCKAQEDSWFKQIEFLKKNLDCTLSSKL